MKKKLQLLIICLSASVLVNAGNKNRIGQSGASELRINPWSASSGMANANSASVAGLEAMHVNIAGLAFTKKTDLMFSRTSWLSGSEIDINAFGISQKIGESSFLGLAVMSMNFGEIEVTTVDLPEGGLGTFSPQFMNIGLAYAHAFKSIYVGATVKIISEQIANAAAQGTAFDMGIRYVTGADDKIKFGIALRNVGSKMQFEGDGFSSRLTLDEEELTFEQRSVGFDLPALLSIGASYDLLLGTRADSTKLYKTEHKVTLAGTFISNSFGKDQIALGAEYGFQSYFKARVGYLYEEGLNSNDTSTDLTAAYSGPTAGLSAELPLGKKGSKAGLDYSWRATKSFNGTHSIGIRLNL